MKIDKSKVENQQITLTLHIEESEIEKYLNRAAQKLSNQLKIPGFRKGKAPKSIVEKIVGTLFVVVVADFFRTLFALDFQNVFKSKVLKAKTFRGAHFHVFGQSCAYRVVQNEARQVQGAVNCPLLPAPRWACGRPRLKNEAKCPPPLGIVTKISKTFLGLKFKLKM